MSYEMRLKALELAAQVLGISDERRVLQVAHRPPMGADPALKNKPASIKHELPQAIWRATGPAAAKWVGQRVCPLIAEPDNVQVVRAVCGDFAWVATMPSAAGSIMLVRDLPAARERFDGLCRRLAAGGGA